VKTVVDREDSHEKQTQMLEWNIVKEGKLSKLVLECQLHAFSIGHNKH
jgi:hypothetical protein